MCKPSFYNGRENLLQKVDLESIINLMLRALSENRPAIQLCPFGDRDSNSFKAPHEADSTFVNWILPYASYAFCFDRLPEEDKPSNKFY